MRKISKVRQSLLNYRRPRTPEEREEKYRIYSLKWPCSEGPFSDPLYVAGQLGGVLPAVPVRGAKTVSSINSKISLAEFLLSSVFPFSKNIPKLLPIK